MVSAMVPIQFPHTAGAEGAERCSIPEIWVWSWLVCFVCSSRFESIVSWSTFLAGVFPFLVLIGCVDCVVDVVGAGRSSMVSSSSVPESSGATDWDADG